MTPLNVCLRGEVAIFRSFSARIRHATEYLLTGVAGGRLSMYASGVGKKGGKIVGFPAYVLCGQSLMMAHNIDDFLV